MMLISLHHRRHDDYQSLLIDMPFNYYTKSRYSALLLCVDVVIVCMNVYKIVVLYRV